MHIFFLLLTNSEFGSSSKEFLGFISQPHACPSIVCSFFCCWHPCHSLFICEVHAHQQVPDHILIHPMTVSNHCQESHSELSDSPPISIRGIDRGWSILTRVGHDQLWGLEVRYEVVSHRGQLMASNTNCEEGMGSTYVLAHWLLPPCQSESQTSHGEKRVEQRKQRQGD